jgi:prepilin-type processing-associated H-X9-DG protein
MRRPDLISGDLAVTHARLLLASSCFVLMGTTPPAPAADETAPPFVSSDHFLLARLNAADVLDAPLFRDLVAALEKVGEPEVTWESAEKKFAHDWGFRPSRIESVTFCLPEPPANPDGEVKFALIVTTKDKLTPGKAFPNERRGKTERPGFIALDENVLMHFPDEKTLAIVHEALADRYLAGFAKDPAKGWPLTEAFVKAAAGHAAYAAFSPARAPQGFREIVNGVVPCDALFAAKALAVAIDLKGKEVRLGARARFADATAARKAKDALDGLRADTARAVGAAIDHPGAAEDFGLILDAFKVAKRALTEAAIATNGPDLTATAAYKADFDLAAVLTAAVKKVRVAAEKSTAQGRLKQMIIAVHNYSEVTGALPLHGVDAKGPLKGADGKPLLSWRVALLPYLEAGELYKRFKLDEPWDSEHNKKLIPKMPRIYAVPGTKAPEGKTYYQQVIGPAVMRPGLTLAKLANLDGTANTVAIVEAAEPVIWTKPDDVMIPGKETPKDLKKRFGGHFPGGFNVAMWDGSVRWLDARRLTEKTLWSALRPDDGQPLGPDW